MESIVVTFIASIPATIAALAAYRSSKKTGKRISNGHPLEEEGSIMLWLRYLVEWTKSHEEYHNLQEQRAAVKAPK